ncbi:GNAT family N-acetyltransferase [Ruminococcus sp. NK3A76]|uniref:GNAT family N-acetyltransferase n=1 Tax=Ruminococcus sp. NK3A76 TaxID=877411 RepID=UPI00048C2815|nr:GNAT family N-acetyltransferase [Ruminococcus sp. NK3A76]
MLVRKAVREDIPAILRLLSQVLEAHAAIRPDLFVSGTVKYNADELAVIIDDEKTPVFVAQGDNGDILGHAFVVMSVNTSQNMPIGMKSMYIDDICVDENARRMNVGTALYQHCIAYAKQAGCHDVSLNVWEGNESADKFYRSMGLKPRKTTLEYILD